MKATNKAPEIEAFLSSLIDSPLTRTETIEQGICAGCGHDVLNTSFRDPLSFKEFTISGLCQQCQDDIFGV
tara:strand:- start:598 stop:810 length:213 start_codon:yes stop_codon:yes gene_type:complete